MASVQRFETIRAAKDETIAWLLWYSRTRMYSTLNDVSPMHSVPDITSGLFCKIFGTTNAGRQIQFALKLSF